IGAAGAEAARIERIREQRAADALDGVERIGPGMRRIAHDRARGEIDDDSRRDVAVQIVGRAVEATPTVDLIVAAAAAEDLGEAEPDKGRLPAAQYVVERGTDHLVDMAESVGAHPCAAS